METRREALHQATKEAIPGVRKHQRDALVEELVGFMGGWLRFIYAGQYQENHALKHLSAAEWNSAIERAHQTTSSLRNDLKNLPDYARFVLGFQASQSGQNSSLAKRRHSLEAELSSLLGQLEAIKRAKTDGGRPNTPSLLGHFTEELLHVCHSLLWAFSEEPPKRATTIDFAMSCARVVLGKEDLFTEDGGHLSLEHSWRKVRDKLKKPHSIVQSRHPRSF